MCPKPSSVTTKNFWLNGHEVALIVFDDSSLGNHDKYYAKLEATRTANPLYYVGPREKEQFIQVLLHRLREPKLEGPVRNLFRPSYGGNRNFTLMYSLDAFLVSSDDDMRSSALIEHSPEREPASGTSRETTANRDNQNVLSFARVDRCNWNRLQPKRRITA